MTTNVTNITGGDGVLEALVQKFCTDDPGEDDAGTYAQDAQIVFNHLEALEREARIRQLRRRVDEIDELAVWLLEHKSSREHRSEASTRCVAFGMSLAPSTDATSRAHGLLISKLAQKVTPGAIDEAAVDEYVRHIEALARELTRDLVKETKRAKGRKGDGWRPRFLAEVEKEFGEPVKP